jgi:hypothetical protein
MCLFGRPPAWRPFFCARILAAVNPSRLVSLISPKSIDPRRERSDPTAEGERWTLVDVALGLAGLPDPYAAAVRFRWAREMSAMPTLERELTAFARTLATRECWLGAKIYTTRGERVAFPLADLVRLALLEEHYTALRKSEFIATVLNVREPLWCRRLRPKYEALRQELESWNSIAHAHLRERLEP